MMQALPQLDFTLKFPPLKLFSALGSDRPRYSPSAYGAPHTHVERVKTAPVGGARREFPEQALRAWSSPSGIVLSGYVYAAPKVDESPRNLQNVVEALPDAFSPRQREPETAGVPYPRDDGTVAEGMRSWVGSVLPEKVPMRKPSPYKKSPHAPFAKPSVDRIGPLSPQVRAGDTWVKSDVFYDRWTVRQMSTPFVKPFVKR